jgi:hypothetical protein
MARTWQIVATLVLLAIGLWQLRLAAGNLRREPRQDVPDLVVGLWLWLATTLLTLQPVSSALLWAALAAGLGLADKAKRQTLREPIVFADAAELPQVFTHPHFYIPFAGPAVVYGGGAALALATLFLFSLEPPVVAGLAPAARLAGILMIAAPIAAYFCRPAVTRAAGWLGRLRPTGEPETDARQLGLLASIAVHTVLARSERPARQARAGFPPIVVAPVPLPPLVLVQAESFFDIGRRLALGAPALLPNHAACLRQPGQHGQLRVSAWGANTIRSEFAVLSGLSDADLGLDRFNPYYAFARRRIDSLAWRLRQAGYLTICVHPYDRRFYGRDRVMPRLGFERFVGVEEFAPAKDRFVSDEALAAWINRTVEREGRAVFVYAISVGNHGPWNAPSGLTGEAELDGYIEGLRRTDRMLGMLANADWLRRRRGLLGLYGDHQPSLSRLAPLPDTDTDYLLIDPDATEAMRIDLDAHQLGQVFAERVAQRATKDLRPFQNHKVPNKFIESERINYNF